MTSDPKIETNLTITGPTLAKYLGNIATIERSSGNRVRNNLAHLLND